MSKKEHIVFGYVKRTVEQKCGWKKMLDLFSKSHKGVAKKRLFRHARVQSSVESTEEGTKLRTIFASSPDAITTTDLNGNITECSQATLDIHGFSSKEELIGKNALELIAKKDHQRAMENLKKTLEQGSVGNIEYTFLTKDGREFPAELSASVIKDPSGKPTGFVAVTKDITERKKAEERIRESEEKYRNLFENARDVIVTFDLKGNVTSINNAVTQYGFKKDEFVGKNMRKFVSKKYWPRLLKDLASLARGNLVENEIEIITSRGRKIAKYRSNPIRRGEKAVGVQSVLRDITERKMAEEALRESEERLRRLIEYAPDAIYMNDLKGNFIDGNIQAENLIGYKKDELIGKNFLKIGLLPKSYVPKAAKALMKNLLGQKTGPEEFELIRKDGRRVTVEISTFPVKRSGKVEVIGIARDITKRRIMEERIAYLASIVDNAKVAIATVDMNGVVTYCNRATEEMLGWTSKEAIGKPMARFCPNAGEQIEATLKEGFCLDKELEYVKKDGSSLPCSTSTFLIKDKDGNPMGICGIAIDIMERKQMEEKIRRYSEHLEELVEERTEKLRKTERMAAIGRTAGMVGHDLRNPLQAMVGALYLARKKLESMASQLEEKRDLEMLLRAIEEQVEYMNKVVSDLQDYGRPLKPELTPTSLHQLINDSLSTIRFPENVRVSEVIPEDFPKLMVDPELMRRVFTNLVTNALQAMPDGGRLTIRLFETKENASISVEDTGVGMPEEDLPKLFQPLFTTKSKGQGFGLAVCKRLVEAHGGSITAESMVGKGSTFTVEIPLRRGVSQSE